MAYGYTIRDWVASINDINSPAGNFAAVYNYFDNGNVSKAQFHNPQNQITGHDRYHWNFGYDGLNRLTSADYGSGASTASGFFDVTGLSYDAAGNLTGLQRDDETGSLIDNLTYNYVNGTNRLGSVSDVIGATVPGWDAEDATFSYDAGGNLVSQSGKLTSITYEHRNLPVQFALAAGDTIVAGYNAAGQRILKETSSGVWQFYIMDRQQTLAVIDNTGFSHFNLVGNATFGRWEPSGARRYYITDHLGSTRAVTDQSGTILETFDYYPFGLLMPKRSSTTGNTIEKFTGHELDNEANLGLIYAGARYMDPALGRWHSVDPLAEEYPSWSPYNYVLNNPLVLVDPDGRCPEGYKPGDIWNGSVCGPEIVVTAKREPEQESQANVSLPLTGLGSITTGSRVGPVGIAASLLYLNYLAAQELAQQGILVPSHHTGTIMPPMTGDKPWWETRKANATIDGTDIVLPKDPTTSPGIDWEWRGRGKVGSKEGAWHNPKTGESLHPDLDHPKPIGPHWDYKDKTGKEWRVDPESGTKTPKN